MDRGDAAIPRPGSAELAPVSPSGDMRIVSGVVSLEAWAERALSLSPLDLLWAPTFGAGIKDSLGRRDLADLESRCRLVLESDDRVASANVTASWDDDAPDAPGVNLTIEIVTAQGEPLTFSQRL